MMCKWTKEDLDRLRLMWAEGIPVGCIAQELDRTILAIKVRLQLLGLLKQGRAKRARAPASASTPSRTWGKRDIFVPARLSGTKAPPWTDPELARLRQMWREGMLVDCIARELDRTPGAVQTRATMLGLPKRSMGNGRVPVTSRRAPDGLPARLRYEDDPRAATEIDRGSGARRAQIVTPWSNCGGRRLARPSSASNARRALPCPRSRSGGRSP